MNENEKDKRSAHEKYYDQKISNKYKLLQKLEGVIAAYEDENATESDTEKRINANEKIRKKQEDCKKILSDIEELKRQAEQPENVWGDNAGTDDIDDLIDESFDDAKNVESKAEQEFGKRAVAISVHKDEEKISELKRIFQTGDVIKNTLIYVATFFEGLSTNEFNEVVSILLKGKSTEVTIQKEKTTKKGNVKVKEEKEEKNALTVWKESLDDPDKYLNECNLKSVVVDQHRVIDFQPSTLRRDMKTYLREEQPIYIDNLVEKTKIFMFHHRKQIARGGMIILTDEMLIHPDIYNECWLLDKVITLTSHEIHGRTDELTQLNKLQLLLELLLDGSGSNQLDARRFDATSDPESVFSRVSGLLYFMLDNEALEPKVNKFLDKLMGENTYAVSRMVDRLDHAKGFDSLYWIKRILNNGKGKAFDQARETLSRKVNVSGFRIYEVLDDLSPWLPSTGECSPPAKVALEIFINYCSNAILAVADEDYGHYKSEYLLFRSFYKGDVDKKFSTLIGWLFYPVKGNRLAIEALEDTAALEGEGKAIDFLGFLIAEWFMILAGLENKTPPENAAAIEVMLEKVVQVLKDRKNIQAELANYWRELASYYLYRINYYLPKTNDSIMRKASKRFTRRRKVVRKLSQQFKVIRKAHYASAMT